MSLHLERVVEMRDHYHVILTISHLVLMVSYMCVTVGTREFRYPSFALPTLFIIMIMTSSLLLKSYFNFGNCWRYANTLMQRERDNLIVSKENGKSEVRVAGIICHTKLWLLTQNRL